MAFVEKLVATDPGNRWAQIRSKTVVRALNWNIRAAGVNSEGACTMTRRVRETLDYWVDNIKLTLRDYTQSSERMHPCMGGVTMGRPCPLWETVGRISEHYI